jgi:hypothetical protein
MKRNRIILITSKKKINFVIRIATAIIIFLVLIFVYKSIKNCIHNVRLQNTIINTVKAGSDSNNPYYIYVDLDDCKLYLYKKGKLVCDYGCSGGKPTTPSPIGTWTIVSKDTWGEGFGGRWMGINVPWGKYGIHGTIYPGSIGWNSSHGCIRMNNKDVAKLYKIVPHGTKVKIVKGPYGNFGSGFRTLKSGDRGSDVYEVQRILKDKGYFQGYIGGIFGSDLKDAVHRFKKDHKLYGSDIIDTEMYKAMGIELMD